MSKVPSKDELGSKSNETKSLSKSAKAVWISVISLVLAVVVVAITNTLLGIDDGVTVVAILLVPLLVYGVVSGRITEFTGPGGWGAKFEKTTSKKIEASELIASDAVDATTIAKAGDTRKSKPVDILEEEIIKSLPQSGGPSTLTMQLGIDYAFDDVASVIGKLYKLPNFKFVVFTAEDSRFIAYAPPQALIPRTVVHSALDPRSVEAQMEPQTRADSQSSSVQQSGAESSDKSYNYDTATIKAISGCDAKHDLSKLIAAIQEHREHDIKAYPGMNITTVRANSTNAEALETMEDLDQDAIVVVDDQCRFKGVVERDRIINHIIVELVNGGEES